MLDDVGLVLGPIQFFGREVPDTINVGGKQMLIVHKNIGGSRIVDAMGPDDDEIRWSGLLLSHPGIGLFADQRARTIDALRESGEEVSLVWPGFYYDVVVHSFEAIYKDQWVISYKISCVVVDDGYASPFLTTLDQAVSTDIASMQAMLIDTGGTP